MKNNDTPIKCKKMLTQSQGAVTTFNLAGGLLGSSLADLDGTGGFHPYLLNSGADRMPALNQWVTRELSVNWNPIKTRLGWAVFQYRLDLAG